MGMHYLKDASLNQRRDWGLDKGSNNEHAQR